MQCHEVDYEIIGNAMQMVEVELDPNETVVAEAGAMICLDQDIVYESKMGDGSNLDQGFFSRLFSAGKRMITGESLFMTHFTNEGGNKQKVSFGAPYPGSIIALDMEKLGGEVICQKDAFLCAALGTKIDITFNRRLGSGFFGGEGFILERLQGDGMAFVHAGGTVVAKQLNNETLRVDTGCMVAFTAGIEYDIEMVRGLKSMFFGGEGMFLATLKGTGTVWVQSLPFSRMAERVLEHAPSGAGVPAGEE
ncbi:MAG: TIGR00266 family protein [Pseudomonadales bacterium]|nr:TIGR00266 family protein [Pseudomonadales bacterium]